MKSDEKVKCIQTPTSVQLGELCNNCIETQFLCAICDNILSVEVYSEEFGFYSVHPCKHCATLDDYIIPERFDTLPNEDQETIS